MTDKPLRGPGLSPSGLATFQSCQRKYYFSKVANTPKDPDVSDDVEALQVGSAFHKCLEDTKHVLDGYGFKDVAKVAEEHGLGEDLAALIFAMLGRYKEVHLKAGLSAVACEVIVDTPRFYGIVDVVLKAADGAWWIGDMKTAASFRQDLIPSLPLHPQLNLYAAHAPEIAAFVGLEMKDYQGCRYRLTTKSKISRKGGEDVPAYIGRLLKSVKSFDFILPKAAMNPEVVYSAHQQVMEAIERRGPVCSPNVYPQNLSSCQQWFRPCDFWSQCHGKPFSEMMGIDVVTSE